MATSNIAFTPLVEPSSVIVSPSSHFETQIAWLLAQLSGLTYSQYDSGPGTLPDFSSLTLGPKYKVTASAPKAFTVSEPAGPGSIPGDSGDYYPAAAGFGVTININGSGINYTFAAIALRGTRTWTEWLDDAEAVPAVFDGNSDDVFTYGCVHAGILGYYTLGTNGQTYPSGGWMNARPTGSLAAQVAAYISGFTTPAEVYVTGHSLGGALAPICAYDLAINFSSKISNLYMYSLASPRVVMGADVFAIGVSPAVFLQGYQAKVPNSYRIVHACDVVPILPETDLSFGSIDISAAHVTDAWSLNGQSSPGLPNNIVNFCAQSGDLATNHSCLLTYLPYAQWLASQVSSQPVKSKGTAA